MESFAYQKKPLIPISLQLKINLLHGRLARLDDLMAGNWRTNSITIKSAILLAAESLREVIPMIDPEQSRMLHETVPLASQRGKISQSIRLAIVRDYLSRGMNGNQICHATGMGRGTALKYIAIVKKENAKLKKRKAAWPVTEDPNS